MKLTATNPARSAGFTMVEIAICLAVIGIALVAIIGVLPIGLHAQRDSREDTFISQDATLLMDALRSRALGLNELTNFVIGVTNYQTYYQLNNGVLTPAATHVLSFTYTSALYDGSALPATYWLTNAANLLGVLSTPVYTSTNFMPVGDLNSGGYSNHIVAYFHSISGPAIEKPPQDNALLVSGSFGYRVVVENVPVPLLDTSPFSYQLAATRHELRMTFAWPLLPNGNIGNANLPRTFRVTVAGQLAPDYSSVSTAGYLRYFYYPQSFMQNTNAL